MKYSDIKKIKEFCESLHSNPDWREVVRNIADNTQDFEVDGVRFIDEDCIHDVLCDELAADEYILGSFNAWAISSATGWPVALIKAAQKGEQYEEIGASMTGEHIDNLAEIYVKEYGYGHHFNHYNGGEEELQIGECFYHVFDNR